jgi:coenzyme PQQ precursor peptide PqqA
MTWKTPRIAELPVGMETNMYACATHRPRDDRGQTEISQAPQLAVTFCPL